jgi:hypothetical protein
LKIIERHMLDTGLLTQWPSEGPPLRWSVKGIGKGIAAAAVAGGQIIMLGDIDGKEYVTHANGVQVCPRANPLDHSQLAAVGQTDAD